MRIGPARATVGVLVGAALAGCGGGGGGSGDGTRSTFVVPHILESSGRIAAVAAGDVNGDGLLDLVLLRESPTKGVTLLESTALRESPSLPSKGKTSRGAAAYSPASTFVFAWDTATDLGLADLDGDGCPDLVVAGGSAREIGVWRCDPQHRGEFLAPVVIPTAAPAVRVATGDVNGDGKADLVVLDEASGQMQVFLQASSSPLSFSVGPVQPPVLGACRGLVVADMDRDGHPDLVSLDPAGSRVHICYQDAAGFMLRESPSKASLGRAMAVADVDGDGWLDVVCTVAGGKAIACLHQRPDAPRTFDEIDSPLSIAIDESGTDAVCIAIGDPGVNGNFTAFPDGGSPAASAGTTRVRESPTKQSLGRMSLALADFDRDGRLDLLTVPAAGDADRDLVLVHGSTTTRGGFDPTAERRGGIVKGGINVTGGSLMVGDLDGDGVLDAVQSFPDQSALSLLYFETGDVPTQSDFQEMPAIDGAFAMRDLAAADLDRDGLLDLVAATSGGLEVRFQDTAKPGSFLGGVTVAQGDCRCVAVGDLNRDGCPDLVVGIANDGACVLRNPASPRAFLPPIPFPAAPPGASMLRCVTLLDLDKDGHEDLVCIRESPTLPRVYRCRGQGNGFFDVFTEVDLGPGNWIWVAAGDVNGDGFADLCVCDDGNDVAAVALQDPLKALSFMPPSTLAFMGGVRVAVGDVNGDGRADLVTAGSGGVHVALQSPDVAGRFLSSYTLSSQPSGGLALGDLDRDGRTDVCSVDLNTGRVRCVTGDPDFDAPAILSLNGLPPGEPVLGTILLEADTDGDGDFEPLVSCPKAPGLATGTIHVWANTHAKP